METNQIITALKCCTPLSVSGKACSRCPLFNVYNCHEILCEAVLDTIVGNRTIQSTLDSIRDKLYIISSDIDSVCDELDDM